MPKPGKRVHLFNCDNTYKLEPVEQLLTATTKKLEKLDIHVDSVKKHPFRLAQMSDMVTKTIPTLEMDMAFFVVHAHESRLSINEDNAGIGYAKIYRALQQETGGNVIIVIGGDDNYKNKDEEDREFISRWAKRKISSQFSEEYLDGSKSFVFSWNKEHRMIHEEALLHQFDERKKGQKFQYQPPKQKHPSKPLTPPPPRTTEPVHPTRLQRFFTLPEEHSRHFQDKWERSSTPKSTLHKDQAVTGQRKEEKLPYSKGDKLYSQTNSTEERRGPFDRYTTDTPSLNTTPFDSNQGARPKETLTPSLEKHKAKDLSILGCNVLESSMRDVRKVLQDVVPQLNLAEPPFENLLSPVKVKEYLMDNHLRFCVLVVDAEEIKQLCEKPSSQSVEYQQLLETAVDKVDKKVVILICGSYSLTQEDEKNVDAIMNRFINKEEKVLPAWLKNGKLALDADVLVQLMKATSAVAQRNPQTTRPNDDQATPSACPTYPEQPQGSGVRNPTEWRMNLETNGNVVTQQPQVSVTLPPPAATSLSGYPKPSGGTVMLKSKLRNGEISYQLKDTEVLIQGFKVPDYIVQGLKRNYHYVSEAVVEIVEDSNGKLRCTVAGDNTEWYLDEEVRLAENETLMLQSRVHYGEVSQRKEDLKCIYPNWEIPHYVTDSIKREYNDTPYGDVYIISNENGELRYHVNIGRKDKVLGTASKAWRTFTHFKS